MNICVLKKKRANKTIKRLQSNFTLIYRLFIKNIWVSTHNNKGQVIIEYILLLIVSTSIALVFVNLVSVQASDLSPVFKYWRNLLIFIGRDIST